MYDFKPYCTNVQIYFKVLESMGTLETKLMPKFSSNNISHQSYNIYNKSNLRNYETAQKS